MSRSLRANLLLLTTAAIWGTAFVAQRVGMESVGPFTYNGVRFALGVLSLLPLIAWRARRGPNPVPAGRAAGRTAFWGAWAAGLVMFIGVSMQQVGLLYTTAGKAGFITGLYVVFVPLLGLLLGQRPGWGGGVGALAAAVGLYLLSVTEGLDLAPGDGWVLLGAVFWAGHVLLLGYLSPRVDPVRLAAGQFAVCAAASTAVALVFEQITWAGVWAGAWPIVYGGCMSVGVAYTLQVVAQKDAQPTPAAIILSLESAFAAAAGYLLLGEVLGVRGIAGCALMLGGMLAAQLWPKPAN
ncbi:MAG: DMT family transporter [Thermodesulfobacteriota bacterium]